MDCGVPFCHEGCPLGNLIPDWNDLVYRDKWREAIDQLHATNNFPEFTGLICPAPCESACVLAINDDPVTIEQIELAIVERAFDEGWVVPEPPDRRSGQDGRRGRRRAGRAGRRRRAQPLRPHGDRLRARRGARAACCASACRTPSSRSRSSTAAWRSSSRRGSSSSTTPTSGATSPPRSCRSASTRVVIAIGSRVSRDIDVPGRELDGIHSAMDYLYQRNRWVAAQQGRPHARARARHARSPPRGKQVIVIGGGDTGMDCISNSHREGAASVVMLDVYAAAARRRRPAPPVAAAAEAHRHAPTRSRRAASAAGAPR